LIANW
jgi:hypothetical protein